MSTGYDAKREPQHLGTPKALERIKVELVCRNGHHVLASISLIVGLSKDPLEYRLIGGSDWDHCEECPDGWRDQASVDAGLLYAQQEVNSQYPQGFGDPGQRLSEERRHHEAGS